jgi:acetate CoA/acetoacetate CoA-transferase beta subunit
MEPQTIIARRIARELKSSMLVNLGIGIPTLVVNYVPAGINVFFQSENGLIGTGAPPEEGMAHPTLTDAGGRPVTALPGASTFDSDVIRAHPRRPSGPYGPWRPAGGSNWTTRQSR